MSYLIQDLLDYSQLKAGKFRKNFVSFNIMHAIVELVAILQFKADMIGISIVT